MSVRLHPLNLRWLLVGLACTRYAGAALTAVATFECVGVYHATNDPSVCAVQYRRVGTTEWRPALDLVYDLQEHEHRGSIVGLRADTEYEVRVTQQQQDSVVTVRTRSERIPIGKTSWVASQAEPLAITDSGTPEGYHLFTPHPETRTTIDVANQADDTVIIDADYVILRGLELRNAARHGVYIKPGRHHIVIEDCRITFWGRIGGPMTYGNPGNMDSAIYADQGAGDLVLQRNLIENPRGAANDWDTGHPSGPQGITLINSAGRNVIRYNEIVSTEDHGFNDAIGGASNFSDVGSPNRDSDIYGNVIAGVWDDGIDAARGTGRRADQDRHARGVRRWAQIIFHNTALQPRGASAVFSGRSDPNTVTRNNIFDTPGRLAPGEPADPPGDYDYDFFSGDDLGVAQETHGLRGRRMDYLASPYLEFFPSPVITTVRFGKIPVNVGGLVRELTDPVVTIPNPVIDGGTAIVNFNDDFAGSAPDLGAFELGRPPLRFGRRAAGDVWAPWELYGKEYSAP